MGNRFRLRDPVADQRMIDTPSLLVYLPHILVYPLSGHALAALLLLTGLLWIGLQSITGIALLAIASPWVFQYAQGVIERTSAGQATPPQFGGDMLYLGGMSALRPLVAFVGLASLWFWARDAHPALAPVIVTVGAFLMPAHLVLLATDDRFFVAFHPLALLHVIVGVGWAYPIVCAVLAGAAVFALKLASQVGTGLALFVLIYTWLMSCHLLGFVVFHRAERLGLTAPDRTTSDEKREQAQFQARLDAVLARIDEALSRRDPHAAAQALYAEPGDPRRLRVFHETLFEHLERRHEPALLHAQGARLITLLIAEKRIAQALDVASTCVDARRDFAPEKAEHALMLLDEALRARQSERFERLADPALRQWPDGPACVSLRFLQARASLDLRGDEARARDLMQPLLTHTGHPQYRQIAALARALGLGA